MTINLLNQNNIEYLSSTDKMFDFIYADCIYEDTNLDWVYHTIPHLKTNGIFIVQTDYHTVADYKHLLDSLDGWERPLLTFVNWLIYMNNWGGVPTRKFAQKHDDILVYCKGEDWKWYGDRIQIPKDTAGTAFDKKGTGLKTPPSVFYDHASFSTMSKERIKTEDGHNIQWQKPLWLMERLLLPFTDVGDEILDLFMGTGSLGHSCILNNRNYTGIESEKTVYELAKKRLADVNTI